MTSSSEKLFVNKRKEPRKPYSGLIYFVYKKKLYPGKLRYYSPSGLFIKAENFFVECEMITVTLPALKYKNHRKRDRIVWKNTEGCGVQLSE